MGPFARPFTFYWWKLRNKVTSNSKETEGAGSKVETTARPRMIVAFGGAYWPLAIAHSDPLGVRTCFGCVNGAPG